MSINKIEIQDAEGNVYHPHTTSGVVFHDSITLKKILNDFQERSSTKQYNIELYPGWGYAENQDPSQYVKVYQTGDVVHMSGIIRKLNESNPLAIGKIPVQFNINAFKNFAAIGDDSLCVLSIDSNGQINLVGTKSWVSFDSISWNVKSETGFKLVGKYKKIL